MTSLIKCKCLDCSLHFIILTERFEEWQNRKIHCPECNNTANFLVWTEKSKKFIFQYVPGKTKLNSIKASR